MSATSVDQLFKILLIGNSGTGKSCILMRGVSDVFAEDYISTVGVDFKIKTLHEDGKVVKLQIWDTAGQERFRTITSSYYRGAHGIVVVYDITNKESFDQISFWMKEVERLAPPDVCRVIIGNKCDIVDKREVTAEEGNAVAQQYGVPFLETSAKDSTNIKEMFSLMTSVLMKNLTLQSEKPVPTTQLRSSRKVDEGGCC